MQHNHAKSTLHHLSAEATRLDNIAKKLQAPADDAATLRAEIASLEGEDTQRMEAWVATASGGADPGPVPQPANLTKLQSLRGKLVAAEHHERLVTRARQSLQEQRNALAVQGEAAGELLRASIRQSLVAQGNVVVSEIEDTIQALASKLALVGGLQMFLRTEGDGLASGRPDHPGRLANIKALALLKQLPPELAELVDIEMRDVEAAARSWGARAAQQHAAMFEPETTTETSAAAE